MVRLIAHRVRVVHHVLNLLQQSRELVLFELQFYVHLLAVNHSSHSY